MLIIALSSPCGRVDHSVVIVILMLLANCRNSLYKLPYCYQCISSSWSVDVVTSTTITQLLSSSLLMLLLTTANDAPSCKLLVVIFHCRIYCCHLLLHLSWFVTLVAATTHHTYHLLLFGCLITSCLNNQCWTFIIDHCPKVPASVDLHNGLLSASTVSACLTIVLYVNVESH